jgi:pSer/pThr/pTyr-binding forkhead associated (FHA) protein
VVIGGAATIGQKWRLTKRRTSIGAARECDLHLDISKLSGKHADFELYPTGALWVRDNSSSNGTSVNGRRLAKGERVKIKPGDQVQLSSDLLLEIRRPGVEAAGPPSPAAAGPAPSPSADPPKGSSKGKTVIYRGK